MNRRFGYGLVVLLLGPLGISCKRTDAPASAPTATTRAAATSPTVASLAPAATDLLIAMGAADHLVAVSSYDPPRPQTAGLPNAGDYQSTDWETLASAHPSILVVQMEESRIPAGLRDRATELGATILNIQIEKLDDIFRTIDQLGKAVHEPAKSDDAATRLRERLQGVRAAVAGMPVTRTLICLNESGTFAAGPGTYLDELLTLAGGRTVLDAASPHWPSIDREQLVALAPQAVIVLLPGATPQVLKASRDFWSSVPIGVGQNIKPVTDPWALTPGFEVGELAERFAAALHPSAHPQPARARQ